MNCERVLRNIDDHVDGLLPAEEAESVRDHLDTCRDCRETAAASKAASTSLAVWGDLDPPSACFDQIMAKIQALPPETLERGAARNARRNVAPTHRRILRWAVPSVAAAAAVVVAFVGTEHRAPKSARVPGAGPVAASAIASPSGSRAMLADGLYPGYERVHLDPNAWLQGVRRSDSGTNQLTRPRVVPAAQFSDGGVFASPR
ncbi:MAG: zf-HC2 domain-containing protein [Planctomycetes bacterium]|nr:zf-HC2 domain-containing protein [Planctomycetota bacterium]